MLAPQNSKVAPLLQVEQLGRRFSLPKTTLWGPENSLQALSDVSFSIETGKSLGIVGESGSGKSTLARLVMALDQPTQGRVLFNGVDLHQAGANKLRHLRSGFQMVFQDPYGSLDPRQKVLNIVTEPIQAQAGPFIAKAELKERAAQALSEVGLRSADLDKYPHEFSGGQRQRIAMARALITRPALIVADEPVSALDVSVQAQVLNLMMDLQDRYGLSYLMVSHDLAVVNLMCDDIVVLQSGRVVEQGPREQIFNHAVHPYTRNLISAVPGTPASFFDQEKT